METLINKEERRTTEVQIFTPLGRLLDGISTVFNAIGTLGIGALTLLVCWDVASRGLFNEPVKGVPEIAATSIVMIVYLQISSSLAAGRWTSSDLLLSKLKGKARSVRSAIEAVYSLMGALLFTFITYATVPYVQDAIESADFVGVPGLFTFPTWPVKTIVVLGSSMCALQFVRLFWINACSFMKCVRGDQ